MEKNLQTFMNSGLIDRYILGDTSVAESMEVEHYISEYPEIETEYNRLQNHLEILSKANAVQPPKHVLESVWETIDTQPVKTMVAPKHRTPWYSIAASFAAIAFALTAFLLYQKNMDLIEENQVVVDEIFDLRSDIDAYTN